ncbi:MAG: subtilin biosynthesis sensor protein SpaK [Lachnospiraceae bacterium]|nr:subtilin biosynthesis sensor protein SpaK [Lachnospiraceae bacterium]
MNYTTQDELNHFDFAESYIGGIETVNGIFHMYLDNVTILPENSCNRDIRTMRANGFVLKISNGRIASLVEEGYKTYDANGKPIASCADRIVEPEDYPEMVKSMAEGMIFSLEKKEGAYEFAIDAVNERTYTMVVAGEHDTEEWDRFLTKE